MSDHYCDTHDIDVSELNGYDYCPKCQREREVEAREAELHARRSDPNMHNMVDAPANAIDHSRDPRP